MLRLSIADPPNIALSNGTAEALKVLALALMALDHTNRFLLADSVPAFNIAGRMAFPLFAFLLGRNLARPGLAFSEAEVRVLKRLFVFGCIATIPYIFLLHFQWWQLNILFPLWNGAATTLLIARQNTLCWVPEATLTLSAGMAVDYSWAGIAVCVASWYFGHRAGWPTFFLWLASVAALTTINGNFAALIIVPLLVYASTIDLPFPRFQIFSTGTIPFIFP